MAAMQDDELAFAMLSLSASADMFMADTLGIPVEEYTEETKTALRALESEGHRCLNPFFCEKLGYECNLYEVYDI